MAKLLQKRKPVAKYHMASKNRDEFEQLTGRLPIVVQKDTNGDKKISEGLSVGSNSEFIDFGSTAYSSGLTTARLATIFQSADDGDLEDLMGFYMEVEEKDPHIFSLANRRRYALARLEWSILPATSFNLAGDENKKSTKLAEDCAVYCNKVLRELSTFQDFIDHIHKAIGQNLSVSELHWERVNGSLELIDIVNIDPRRLYFRRIGNNERELTIRTENNYYPGEPLSVGKFVVHAPWVRNGLKNLSREGLLRPSALFYIFKGLAWKQWAIFLELYGMPLRIGTYKGGQGRREQTQLLKLLRDMGTSGAGIFSSDVDIKIIESQKRGEVPYSGNIEAINRELTKAWLGATLTVETTGQKGTFGATDVHSIVAEEITEYDIRKEADTIRRYLLTPLVWIKFGQRALSVVPHFHRSFTPTRNKLAVSATLEAAQRLGMKLSRKWVHDILDMKEAVDKKDTLNPNEFSKNETSPQKTPITEDSEADTNEKGEGGKNNKEKPDGVSKTEGNPDPNPKSGDES